MPSSPSSIPSAAQHLPRELDRAASSTTTPLRFSTSTEIILPSVPCSSVCSLYASTIRCTSLWRTTSLFPNCDELDAVDAAEDVLHLDEPGALLARQVDLRHVAGDDDLRAEAEPRQEHLHLLGEVFCASSRMMKLSFSVRPRMKASGATSIVPRSM